MGLRVVGNGGTRKCEGKEWRNEWVVLPHFWQFQLSERLAHRQGSRRQTHRLRCRRGYPSRKWRCLVRWDPTGFHLFPRGLRPIREVRGVVLKVLDRERGPALDLVLGGRSA